MSKVHVIALGAAVLMAVGVVGGGGIITDDGLPPAFLLQEDGEQHTLEIIPTDEETRYRIEVPGELHEGNVNGRDLNPDDRISHDERVAEGEVVPGFQGDSYVFTGEIESIALLDGDATLLVDGEELQKLEVAPEGEPATYRIEASGQLIAGDINGRDTNPDDRINDNIVIGNVSAGFDGDSYLFTGEHDITLLKGNAQFLVDGEEVPPDDNSTQPAVTFDGCTEATVHGERGRASAKYVTYTWSSDPDGNMSVGFDTGWDEPFRGSNPPASTDGYVFNSTESHGEGWVIAYVTLGDSRSIDNPRAEQCIRQARNHAESNPPGGSAVTWLSCHEAIVYANATHSAVEVELSAPGDTEVYEKPVYGDFVWVHVGDFGHYPDDRWYIHNVSPINESVSGDFTAYHENPSAEACAEQAQAA